MSTSGAHLLRLDGQWGLLDFSELGRKYVDVYSFFYAMTAEVDPVLQFRWTDQAFRNHPWRGGWSSMHFYKELARYIPEDHRPVVRSIHYGSPGLIEIGGYLAALVTFSKVIGVMCNSFERIDRTYNQWYEGAMERRMLRADVRERELEVSGKELEFAEKATEQIVAQLGIDRTELWQLTENPIARMKILFSLYRRLRVLAEMARSELTRLDMRSVVRDDRQES